jgi:hypothetical protein
MELEWTGGKDEIYDLQHRVRERGRFELSITLHGDRENNTGAGAWPSVEKTKQVAPEPRRSFLMARRFIRTPNAGNRSDYLSNLIRAVRPTPS